VEHVGREPSHRCGGTPYKQRVRDQKRTECSPFSYG
jgi:hypothetical protein